MRTTKKEDVKEMLKKAGDNKETQLEQSLIGFRRNIKRFLIAEFIILR